MRKEEFTARVPWGLDTSLKQKAEDAGLDFDALMEQLALNRSDIEIATNLKASPKIITQLRQHFVAFGVDSIAGQD